MEWGMLLMEAVNALGLKNCRKVKETNKRTWNCLHIHNDNKFSWIAHVEILNIYCSQYDMKYNMTLYYGHVLLWLIRQLHVHVVNFNGSVISMMVNTLAHNESTSRFSRSLSYIKHTNHYIQGLLIVFAIKALIWYDTWHCVALPVVG